MRIDIITLFPEIFDFYFQKSILSRAIQTRKLKIKAHNLRDFSVDKHKTVDDKPFGGGRGMVLKIEPIYKALQKIRIKKGTSRVILFTPRGPKFTQNKATAWSKIDQLILICGRYEGIDERVIKLIDEKISLGNFVMMGGDLAGLIVVESVARLIPGIVGNSESLIAERITADGGFVEYPQYTRPESFSPKSKSVITRPWKVPKVLVSGNHKLIGEWRNKRSKVIE